MTDRPFCFAAGFALRGGFVVNALFSIGPDALGDGALKQEVELKLELAPDAAAAFEQWGLLPAGSKAAKLHAVYFDTPDLDLARRGVSLRIRKSGRKSIQTVKADGGGGSGLFARAEWEMPVTGHVPVLDARTPVAAMLGEAVQAIEPAFHVDVERRTWMLEEDGAQIELVLDRGLVSAGERQSEVCEIELELKAGDRAALFALARRIDAEIAVRPGVLTKAERGYRLRDAAPIAIKAERVALDPSIAAGEAFLQIAGACLRHYRLNEALLLDHYDAKALHQARVAIRRLRSALSLFRPMLRQEDVTRFQDELRWLAGMLGEARNLDVLTGWIEDEDCLLRLEAARKEAHEQVGQWLASARVRGVLIDLAEWLALGAGRVEGEQLVMRKAPAAAFAVRRLRRLRRRMGKDGAHLEKLTDEKRHEVRKDAKKLRYASEFFAALFRGRKQRRRHGKFIAALEEVQAGLGELNDLVIAPGILARHGLSGDGMAAFRPSRKRKLLAAAAAAQEALMDAPRFWS